MPCTQWNENRMSHVIHLRFDKKLNGPLGKKGEGGNIVVGMDQNLTLPLHPPWSASEFIKFRLQFFLLWLMEIWVSSRAVTIYLNIDIFCYGTLSLCHWERAFNISIVGCRMFTIFIWLIPPWTLSRKNDLINALQCVTNKKMDLHFPDYNDISYIRRGITNASKNETVWKQWINTATFSFPKGESYCQEVSIVDITISSW